MGKLKVYEGDYTFFECVDCGEPVHNLLASCDHCGNDLSKIVGERFEEIHTPVQVKFSDVRKKSIKSTSSWIIVLAVFNFLFGLFILPASDPVLNSADFSTTIFANTLLSVLAISLSLSYRKKLYLAKDKIDLLIFLFITALILSWMPLYFNKWMIGGTLLILIKERYKIYKHDNFTSD